MKSFLKDSEKKIGQFPGSLIYMGEERSGKAKITVASFNAGSFREKVIEDPEDIKSFRKDNENLWVNIDGIQNTELIGKIGNVFNIHPLTQEDILNTMHRPKAEDHSEYIFLVVKMLSYNEDENLIKLEHVSLIIGKDFVLSFQEDTIDEFNNTRESIRQNKGKIRELGVDYLAYRLLDFIIDNYFGVVEAVGDRIEDIEDELLGKPTQNTLEKIYKLKNDMIHVRRAIWPLREALSSLEKIESGIIKKTTNPYIRDLYDHIVQLIDTTENYREMISGMMDIYLSSISNRLNEVMKLLTIISTIFIPLNFIAGVYGMNFNTSKSPLNMPELNWYFGYPAVLLVMFIVAFGLFMYFKRKKWI